MPPLKDQAWELGQHPFPVLQGLVQATGPKNTFLQLVPCAWTGPISSNPYSTQSTFAVAIAVSECCMNVTEFLLFCPSPRISWVENTLLERCPENINRP